jgi:hypothetical protein
VDAGPRISWSTEQPGKRGGAEDVDLLARGDSGKNGTQCLLSLSVG